MAAKTGIEAKHYHRGGYYGPGGPGYSQGELHAAGLKQRATQAAQDNRSGPLETKHSNGGSQDAGAMMVKSTAAPAQIDDAGLLTKNATSTRALASTRPFAAPAAPDEAPSETARLGASSGPTTRRASHAPANRPTTSDTDFTTPSSSKAQPGVDLAWGPSATPDQQARNIKNMEKNAEKRRQEAAKAEQAAAAAARNTQNKGSLQSALERFNLAPTVSAAPAPGRDLRERMLAARAPTAPTTPRVAATRTPDQKAADVGEQPHIDV